MKKNSIVILGLIISFSGGCYISKINESPQETTSLLKKTDTIKNNIMDNTNMKLGAFSMSLSVKDLKTSKSFYENLGFTVNGGSMEMNYLIMKNENALIGLFQGMFDGNILTFNPGWNENAKNIEQFDDVRTIQQNLKNKGIALMTEASDTTEGPASIMLADPDGNLILVDQHR
jgi:predicted lactoylglutathione lyase